MGNRQQHMKDLTARLLKNYKRHDRELLLKAEFVLLIIFCGIGILLISLAYSAYWSGLTNLIIYSQLVGLAIMLAAMVLLIRGYYQVAVHTIFTVSFSVAWVILFGEAADSLIIKLDTIVFVIGILAAMPAMLLKNRVPILVYSGLNILIFLGFSYTLHLTTDIPVTELMDYLMDTLLVMVFVSLVSVSSFSIFRQALDSLKQELIERIEVEKKLQQAMVQAEAGAKAKMEFLTNMSHEIRTPINGIMGMAEIALEKNPDRELKSVIHTINREADQLLGIVNGILDFSKIEAGKQEIEAVVFDLAALFKETCSAMSLGVRGKDIEFHASVSPMPPRLIGDPGKVRQVLVNLTGNAVKFTHRGDISVRCDLLDQGESHARVRFTVKDTGIGIPREKQAGIFESFSQADGSTTREFGGTGLGTAISKQLVELMGGEIGFDSEPGKGTTFRFTLTFAKPDITVQPAPSPAPTEDRIREDKDLSGLNILLVEDYPTNQMIARQHLSSAGCRVLTAENGNQAVALFKEYEFHLILMDIQMPEMDGYQATEQIRRHESRRDGSLPGDAPPSRIPIIAMTAHAVKGYRERCLNAGMDDYITKPLKKSHLIHMVRKWAPGNGQPTDHGRETEAPRHTSGGPVPFDAVTALEEFEGDRAFLEELLEEFFETVSEQLADIETAVKSQDMDVIAAQAHSIKGGAANLTAFPLSTSAHNLELAGKSGNLSGCEPLFLELKNEFIRFKRAAQDFLMQEPDT